MPAVWCCIPSSALKAMFTHFLSGPVDLVCLSRDHATHSTLEWNLKQSLKLQTQKIDLKKTIQLCEELINLKLKL